MVILFCTSFTNHEYFILIGIVLFFAIYSIYIFYFKKKLKNIILYTKVNFFNVNIRKNFYEFFSAISVIISFVFLFFTLSPIDKICTFIGICIICISHYIYLWKEANALQSIDIKINDSKVSVEAGDIFQYKPPSNCNCLKIIAFNEYFDTQVDDHIIAKQSLNGIFIQKHLDVSVEELDEYINTYPFKQTDISENNERRALGKKQKYKIGTICVYKDYLLTAFSRFDEHNNAHLTMPEYIQFLINLWDNINRIYAQRPVCVPIMGSGITRIKEHKNIADEDLLKIMLWTFKISEAKFKYPAKLTIIVYKEKIDLINLFDIKNIFDDIH